jgi:hypothetical protein
MLGDVKSGRGVDVFRVEVFLRVHVAAGDRGRVVDESESENKIS